MFTGIIEQTGTLISLESRGGVRRITVEAPGLAGRLREGDSLGVSGVCLTALDVAAFLRSDNTILELIQRWVPVMTLMDWSRSRHTLPVAQVSEPATPDLLLWAFFKPFFTAESIVLRKRNRKFFGDGSGPKPMFGRQLFNLLRHGAMDEAIALALQSYQAQGLKAIRPAVPTEFDHCRLASALGLSISPGELAYLVNRWLEPIKNNNENAQ